LVRVAVCGEDREGVEYLKMMRSVELLWREEGVQVDVSLTHVISVGVDDLQQRIHSQAHVSTPVHLCPS
jgi:hypothetical protein